MRDFNCSFALRIPHSTFRIPHFVFRSLLWSLVAVGWLIESGSTLGVSEPSPSSASLSNADIPASSPSFRQAVRWYRQSQWTKAARAFARIARQTSDSPQRCLALFYEAECLVQLGDYRQAHARYDTLRRVDASATRLPQAQFRQVRFRWGETAWHAGQTGAAEKALQQFVQQFPGDPLTARALLYLGDLANADKRHQQAAGCYRRLLKQFPESSHGVAARLGLGQTLLARGEAGQAITAVEQLTTAGQGPGEAWLLLARAYYHQGLFEKSLAILRGYQARFQQDDLAANAHFMAAWALWRLGRLDQIEDELAPLGSMARWQSKVQYLRGMTAYARKEWAEAARLLSTAALTERSTFLDAMLYYAGESNRRAGQWVQARKCFERLLNELPESEWIGDTLQSLSQLDHSGRETAATGLLEEARRLQQDGHFDAAIAAYHTLLDRSREHPSDELPAYRIVLWRAGRLHEKLGQFAEACALYEQLLKDSPHDPHVAGALFRLGEIARRRDNLDQAELYYRQVHTKFPQTGEAREAAYWLALRAADNNDSPEARRYTDWLLAMLSPQEPETLDSVLPPEEAWLRDLALSQQEAAMPVAPAEERRMDAKRTGQRRQQLLVHALYLQSQLAAREGAWEQVRTLLKRLLEVAPEGELQTVAQFWLAEAEFRLRHDEAARRRFEELAPRVVGLDEPWVPMVSLRQAQLAAGRQQWTRVLQWTDELRRDWPDFPLTYEVQYLRGRSLAGRGEMSAARAAYQSVIDHAQAAGSETAAMAQWMIGETYFHQQHYRSAREAYFRVIDRHAWVSWQTRAALQAGKCWELEGRWKQAEKLYVDALQRQGDAPSANQLRTRLRWVRQIAESKL